MQQIITQLYSKLDDCHLLQRHYLITDRAGVSILAALCGFVIGGPSPPLPSP